MLYNEEPVLSGDYVILQVHLPRTSGTSLRLLFREVFGSDKCLMNYKGELSATDEAMRRSLRIVAGHVPYGDHRLFDKPAHYITVVRDPIERYKSTYAEFLTNPDSPHHALARSGDINHFLLLVLDAESSPGLRQQLNNLQCRLVCGEASFERARQFIDERYYLACGFPETEHMVALLRRALGVPAVTLPHANETNEKLKGLEHLMHLTPESLALLLESESQDMLLYSYVQKAFTAVREGTVGARAVPAPATLPAPARIPPEDLRFMGEDDATFVRHADYLASGVREVSGLRNGPRRMLDIGCGYGRLAYGLRRAGYQGTYQGFDILPRHIGWLNEQFAESADDARYCFSHADIYNERYNPEGKPLAGLELPFEQASFDCLVSLSVFTHLYEQEVVDYVRYLKRFLAPDGVWVTTFFSVPPECSLTQQPSSAVFPLVKQVSANAYIHNPDEPLFVIGYREQFLLGLFAREGLEVVRQRKGRWLTNDNAVELQDWFVLRLREDSARAVVRTAAPATSTADAPAANTVAVPSTVCNICGNTVFGGGPGGRSARTGLPPCCSACGSLERHRIVRRVFEALPVGFLAARDGLQFSADRGVEPGWFRRYEISEYGGQNSLDAQAIDRPDGSYGFISLNHVLESVPDDMRAFGELCRILRNDGVLQVCFGSAMEREVTQQLAEPRHEWGTLRLYGRDIAQRFNCAERGITVLAVEEEDQCTGVREVVHFFFKRPADAQRVRQWVAQWSDTVRVLE